MKKIEAIRKRLDAATPGPWRTWGTATGPNSRAGGRKPFWRIDSDRIQRLAELRGRESSAATNIGEDAAFIASAPTDIKWLLAVVRDAKSLLKQNEDFLHATRTLRTSHALESEGDRLEDDTRALLAKINEDE